MSHYISYKRLNHYKNLLDKGIINTCILGWESIRVLGRMSPLHEAVVGIAHRLLQGRSQQFLH